MLVSSGVVVTSPKRKGKQVFAVKMTYKGRERGRNYYDTLAEAQAYARELAEGGSPCEVTITEGDDRPKLKESRQSVGELAAMLGFGQR